MNTALLVLHIIVSIFLVFIVLIQGGGKGAELGAAFGGGSSQTLFGGRGAATFLSKITTGVAVLFMVTSLLLAISSVRSKSIIKQSLPVAERPTQAPAGILPEAPAAPASSTPANSESGK